MKNYEVTLWLVVNPSRDAEVDTPETETFECQVSAHNGDEAVRIASGMHNTGLSVYESMFIEV